MTIETLTARLKRIDNAPDLDKDAKQKLTDQYKEAIEQLKGAADWHKKVDAWQERRDKAPQELKDLKSKQDAPPPELKIPDDATLAQLDQWLADAEAELQTAQHRLADPDVDPKRHRAELPGLLTAAQGRLKAVDQELATLPPGGDVLDLSEARRAYLAADRRRCKKS